MKKIKRETYLSRHIFMYQKQSLIYERFPRKIRLGGPRIPQHNDNARYFERSYFSLPFPSFYSQFRQDSHSLLLPLSLSYQYHSWSVDTEKKNQPLISFTLTFSKRDYIRFIYTKRNFITLISYFSLLFRISRSRNVWSAKFVRSQ